MFQCFVRLSGVALVCAVMSLPASAQPGGRRVTTLEALAQSPIFFHGEEVVIHAEATADGVLVYLVNGEARLLALDVPPPPGGIRERLEIVGTYYDVGRLEPDDQRMSELPFSRLSNALLGKSWPGVGELPILVATSSRVVTDHGFR